jgi:hypothetical protein
MSTEETEGDFTPEELAVLEEPSTEEQEANTEPAASEEAPEASQEAESAEEALEQQEEAPQERQQSTVPHGALHQERERRKAVEAQLQTQQEQINQLLARIQVPQDAEQEQAPPDLNADPVEFFKHELDTLKQEQAEAQERFEERQQIEQAQQFEQSYINELTTRGQSDPEFQGAIDYLFETTVANYKSQGATDEEAKQLTMRDAYSIAANAHNNGWDIGKQFYGFAFSNGYKPQAQEDPAPDLDQKLETIQKGQEKNKTLSGKGGGAPEPMSLEKLVNMSDDDFKRWTDANPGVFERLQGAA